MRPANNHFMTIRDERGVSLVLVAICMVMLLAVSALAIDLASLYVARNEAQRAADAAALAGAKVFVETSCVTASNCSFYQSQAQQRAIDVGGENTVANQTASIQTADITFTSLNSNNPRITVVVQRSAARSNPVPTFFAKIFGPRTANVSAAATAEAYVPTGLGPGVCAGCIKPFIFPNCDVSRPGPPNPNCAGNGLFQSFVNSSGQVVNPGLYPSGVIGMPWAVHAQLVPSQYGTVDVGGGQSQLRNNITNCTTSAFACGDTLPSLNGKKVGPVNQSINQLINAQNDGMNKGQDAIAVNTSGPPFTIQAGSNNPLVLKGIITAGTPIATSSSIGTFALANEADIVSGKSPITIQGYMTVFIQDADHNASTDFVNVIVMSVSGCGTGGSCTSGLGGGNVAGGGVGAVPIRLVRNPGS